MSQQNLKNRLQNELLKLERIRGLNDFFFFCEEILGYDVTEHAHREMCEYVSNENQKRRMILMPRYSYKTTTATVALIVWRICRDPNIRIMLASESYDPQGLDIMRMVKTQLESNQKLRLLYGEFDSQKDTRPWKAGAIEVSQRTLIDRNPTVAVGSLKKVDTGSHFDLIILDDIVSKDNIETNEQIQKVINYWKAIHSILSPTGELQLVGTRWSFDELYGYIIENEELNKQYKPFIREAVIVKEGETLEEVLEKGDPARLFFPEELSYEFLRSQKTTQGDYLFCCLYQNDPLPASEQDFKPEWIQYYEWDDIKDKRLRIYILVDPAISQKKDACDTAIVVCAEDEDKNLYLVDYTARKMIPNEIISTTYDYAGTYEPYKVGVEDTAFQESLSYGFKDKAKELNWYLPIVGTGSKTDKFVRIRAIQPRFAARKVFIQKKHFTMRKLLQRFPKLAKNKLDLLDAFASVVPLLRPLTTKVETKTPHPRSFKGLMRRMKKAKDIAENPNMGGITFEEAFRRIR